MDTKSLCRSEVGGSIDMEDIIKKPYNIFDKSTFPTLEKVVIEMLKTDITDTVDIKKFIIIQQRIHHITIRISHLLYMYRVMSAEGKVTYNKKYEKILQSKTMRSDSGVMVIAIFTAAYPKIGKETVKFSCKYDCHYCPAEPGQPRSYLKEEPGVLRANRNKFDPVDQFYDRANSYFVNGHPVDKIECLVLGGTWSSYPKEYQETFIRDIYYAANTYYDREKIDNPRDRLSVEEEIKTNRDTRCRIIGLTLETRPDQINFDELMRFRRFGVTRVQIGVQHTDDRLLYRQNRMSTRVEIEKAIKLLKDFCFKIDIHLMPDLPQPFKKELTGKFNRQKKDFTIDQIDTDISVQKLDKKMFYDVFTDPNLQVDQHKWYPCEVVPWSRNQRDYHNKIYKPYAESTITIIDPVTKKEKVSNPLFELILKAKTEVPPWIRLNRVIRDIPGQYIEGGNKITNMRQELHKELTRRGLTCNCVRCHEPKGSNINHGLVQIMVREYEASGGTEYYISFETPEVLYVFQDEVRTSRGICVGHLRLRLSKNAGKSDKGVCTELNNCAMIRELHVYGSTVKVGGDSDGNVQHRGYGKRLLEKAKEIAIENGYNKIAVIPGVGVERYYEKLGYTRNELYHTMIIEKKEIHSIKKQLKKKDKVRKKNVLGVFDPNKDSNFSLLCNSDRIKIMEKLKILEKDLIDNKSYGAKCTHVIYFLLIILFLFFVKN